MMQGESKLLALSAIFEDHRPMLYATALRMLGHGDDAKDAVQETLLKAITHIDTLKDAAAIGGWFKAILRNQCLMELRYRKRRLVTETNYYNTADAVSEAMHESEQNPYAVREVIGKLSEPLQATAMLRFFGSANSYEEMANILSVPVGTVRSRLAEVRGKLSGMLQPAMEYRNKSSKAQEMEQFYMESFHTIYDDVRIRSKFLNHMDKDLLIILSSGNKARGIQYIEQQIEYDLYYGARAKVREVHSTGNISILEVDNITHPDNPDVCPPASTFIMVHPKSKADKMYFHNAAKVSM